MLHTGLTSHKWTSFSIDKQILMIANEMNRAKNWIKKKDFDKVRSCYERALELIDLTAEVSDNLNFIKEILRFREQLAVAYIKNVRVFDEVLYSLLLGMNVNSFNLMREI